MTTEKLNIFLPSKWSLQLRIALVSVACCAFAVSVACAALIIYELSHFKRDLHSDHTTIAEVVAANLPASIVFEDHVAANEALHALRLIHEVQYAQVLTEAGEVFVSYHHDQTGAVAQKGDFVPNTRDIHVQVPVMLDTEIVGKLDLFVSTEQIQVLALRYVLIAFIVFVISVLVGYIIAHRLARPIAKPLRQLRDTMMQVQEKQDYSRRVSQKREDELGAVAKSFNDMLIEIEGRDKQLAEIVDQLIEARDGAERANIAKSQFLANMSHELRTPLNAIIGYSEMLSEDLEDEGQTQSVEDLNRILNAARHLLGLINEILDLSKIEAGHMDVEIQSIDIQPILSDCVSTIEPTAQKNGNIIKLDISSDLGEIESDITKIRQCILNLLANAAKFTHQGQIVVRCQKIYESGNELVRFSVEDTGIGMSDEQLGNLFQPFVQADSSTTRKYGGTGLGLTITQRLAQLLGGDVSVKSEIDVGSTFMLTLPIRYNAVECTELPLVQSSEDPLSIQYKTDDSRKPFILVIDDDSSTIDLIQCFLQKTHYSGFYAQGGKEGLKQARLMHPDIILLNMELSDIAGRDVLANLKSDPILRDIPVIMVCVDDNAQDFLAQGAHHQLVKPFDRNALLALLEMMIPKKPVQRVVVVEDDEIIATKIAQSLHDTGLKVHICHCAAEVESIVDDVRPDGVVLDLCLPDGHGGDLIARLYRAKKWRNIPIIIATGQSLNEDNRSKLQCFTHRIREKHIISIPSIVEEVKDMIVSESEPV